MIGRQNGKRLALVAALAVLAVTSAASVGCAGDSPYKTAAKAVVQEFELAGEQADQAFKALGPDPAGDSAETQSAAVDDVLAVIADMSEATQKAQDGLRALAPPDAAARAFQSDYLDALGAYSEGLATLAENLTYSAAARAAVDPLLPGTADSGVWAQIEKLGASGVTESNVARAAEALVVAKGLTGESVQAWGAVAPPEELKAAHEALGTDLGALSETYSAMTYWAQWVEYSGKKSGLAELAPLWELAIYQSDALRSEIDSWLSATNARTDSTWNQLTDLEDDFDRLEKRLKDL